MNRERLDLAMERIRKIKGENTVAEQFRPYFEKTADFMILLEEVWKETFYETYYQLPLEELEIYNHRLYEDILPENYETSYGNPAYAVKMLGRDYGQILSFLYAEIRACIPYAFEQRLECMTVVFELFIEIYNSFEEEKEPQVQVLKDIVYWYAMDYCEVFAGGYIKDQFLVDNAFASDIIHICDLDEPNYLYFFGEYITENELRTAMHLKNLPEETIGKMAAAYTEGLRRGFINTGRDISKKRSVGIRYPLGFERMMKKACGNFMDMELELSFFRGADSAIVKNGRGHAGYGSTSPNKQYEYDHRNDHGLFFDKRFVERKLEVVRNVYEKYKEEAAVYAGPTLVESFGEAPFSPVQKPEAIALTEKQEELQKLYDGRAGQMANAYTKRDEGSFTIISYPIPAIGEPYEEILDEVIKINTLDSDLYARVQQTIIDALDQGEYVRILGGNGNRTDMTVQLYRLNDPEKETIFENCVADVNTPVGEVFTSPVLEGTSGVLHVSYVYLHGLLYKDLEITFANGMISDYRCGNFEREADGKKYIANNILHNYPTLPLGEFAIGTNTAAYVMAKKYNIEDKLTILIAEKTGPHFAVGDTCYSWSEDVKVYNPNGKEIVARDNSVSILRKEDVSKAYFQCHTDITIPYEELQKISVVSEDGQETVILENGRFVLPGTEILNEPLQNTNK